VKQIELLHKKPAEVMEIVREMRENGITQGEDFDFAYHPPTYNNDGYEAVTPGRVVFAFYTEKYATWFSIKWS